ncbi:MAG: hypothetical protein SFV81_08520 [Pirellulaceae bacterium]|nr:hypothetical protein [Pirellulaceae bacterium]
MRLTVLKLLLLHRNLGLKNFGFTELPKNIVSRLLWGQGYRRGKPLKKRTMGQHADRNAQFKKIAKLKAEFLEAGQPVISINTKKKAMLGNFDRGRVTDAVEPTIVNDHDIASQSGHATVCRFTPLESPNTTSKRPRQRQDYEPLLGTWRWSISEGGSTWEISRKP